MSVLVFKNFLDRNTCSQLNDWVDLGVSNKWLDKGMNKDVSWGYDFRSTTRNYGARFEYSNNVYEVQKQISVFLGIEDLPKSIAGGKNGIIVSCTFNGGDIFKHTDQKEGNLEVLRCNIMTRDSEDGGELFIGGNKIDIHVGDLHCYLPSTVEHYVTEVKGKTSRIMWMFGYQCSIDRFNSICNDKA